MVRNSKYAVSSLCVCALALSGCGHRLVAPRSSNPVIADSMPSGLGVVSTRADRRTVIIAGPNSICAEPPPDVAESLIAKTIAGATINDNNAAFEQSLQTAIQQLADRSQGLEYYRAAAFTYCTMYSINGSIGKAEYMELMDKAAEVSAKLMELQIKEGLPERADPFQVQASPAPKTPDAEEPKAKLKVETQPK